MLRQVAEPAVVAGDGPGEVDVLPRVQDAARRLPGPRRAGGVGAVGQAQGALHARLRGLGGVPGGALHGERRANVKYFFLRGTTTSAPFRRTMTAKLPGASAAPPPSFRMQNQQGPRSPRAWRARSSPLSTHARSRPIRSCWAGRTAQAPLCGTSTSSSTSSTARRR